MSAPNPASARNLPLYTDEEVEERLGILLEGITQYNEGFFFEAHEILEGLWLRSPWPTRRFLQGLIQLAAAFVHFARSEYSGTVRLLAHAEEKLVDFVPRYLGVDVAGLMGDVGATRSELEALGPEGFQGLPVSRIPRVRLASSKPQPPGKV